MEFLSLKRHGKVAQLCELRMMQTLYEKSRGVTVGISCDDLSEYLACYRGSCLSESLVDVYYFTVKRKQG